MKKHVAFLAGIFTALSLMVGVTPAQAALPALNVDVTLLGVPAVGEAVAVYYLRDDADVTVKWYSGTKVISTLDGLDPIPANLAGKTIKAVVTAKQDGYKTYTFTSAPIKIGEVNVTYKGWIGGEALVGQEVSYFQNTTLPFSSADGGTASSALQWKADGVNIAGATNDVLTITSAMVGKKISCTEIVSYDGLASKVTTTTMAKSVLNTLEITNEPTLTASPIVGTNVTLVTAPVWDVTPDRVTYQWYRDGKPISKATLATYKLTTADWHKTIHLKITGSKAGYLTYSKVLLAEIYVLKEVTKTMPVVSGYELWQECEYSNVVDGCNRSLWNPNYVHVSNTVNVYLSAAFLTPETDGSLVKWRLEVSARSPRVTVVSATADGAANIVAGSAMTFMGSVTGSTDWFTTAADAGGYVHAGMVFDSEGESIVRWAKLTAVVRE